MSFGALKYGTSTERLRGLVFAERFVGSALIEKNGGTVWGSPTFLSQGRGVVLDGIDDCISFKPAYYFQPYLSVRIDFTPRYAADAGMYEYFFETSDTNYRFYHDNGNSLVVRMGGTQVLSVAIASYQSYWKVGRRNSFVLSCKSGSNRLYLNGVLIGSSATVWTRVLPDTFYVGSRASSTYFFSGVLHAFQIWDGRANCAGDVLSAAEVTQLYNRRVYRYLQDAVSEWRMLSRDHVAGSRSRDRSPRAYHAAFSTPAPTKRTERGYTFNGTNHHLDAGDRDAFSFGDGAGNDLPFSVLSHHTTLTVMGNVDELITKRDLAGSVEYSLRYIGAGLLLFALYTTGSDYIGRHAIAVGTRGPIRSVMCTYSGNKATSGVAIYDMGTRIDTTNYVAGTYTGMTPSSVPVLIGATISGASYIYRHKGDIYHTAIVPYALTQMQACDYAVRCRRWLHKV